LATYCSLICEAALLPQISRPASSIRLFKREQQPSNNCSASAQRVQLSTLRSIARVREGHDADPKTFF